MVTQIPASAIPFGKSPKITQPSAAATGISRYCIGASVLAGAKRRLQVISR